MPQPYLKVCCCFSGAYEYWEAGTKTIKDDIFVRPGDVMLATGRAASARMAATSFLGASAAPEPKQLAVESVAAMLSLAGPLTNDKPLLNHLRDLLDQPNIPTPVHDLRDFDDALTTLNSRPAREIDVALRGLLDGVRIGSMRGLLPWRPVGRQFSGNRDPEGVHIGCYGIVHDLQLDAGHGRSEGFLHVPSVITSHGIGPTLRTSRQRSQRVRCFCRATHERTSA